MNVCFSYQNILPMNGYELKYDFDSFDVGDVANCYMYALNTIGFQVPRGGPWLEPGINNFTMFVQTHCDDMYYYRDANGEPIVMEALMLADQARCHFTIEPIDINEVCPDGMYKVALYFFDHDDFHWIRQNSDGTWSTKYGGEDVCNEDFSHNPILDPRTADFGEYEYIKCYATNGLPFEGQPDYNVDIPEFSYEALGIIRD